MTAIPCPHCDRSCAGPAGLSSHIRSLHPEHHSKAEDKTVGIVWETPPPRRPGRTSRTIDTILEALPALQGRPGEWARVAVYSSKSSAGSARTACQKKDEFNGLEFRASQVGGPGSRLYARWIGTAA